MFKTIKNAINNTIDATIINAFTILSRYFVTLDPVLNSHYEMAQPITFAGDFEVEVEFSTTTTDSLTILVGSTTDTTNFIAITSAGAIRVKIDGDGADSLANILPMDGKLHTLKIKRVGYIVTKLLDNVLVDTHTMSSIGDMVIGGIGLNSAGFYFDGIIANAKFTDKSGASDVVTTFKLDNSPAAENYTYSTELLDNNTFPDNANARQYLVATKGWIITDGGAA